jgi:hypothetical protein
MFNWTKAATNKKKVDPKIEVRRKGVLWQNFRVSYTSLMKNGEAFDGLSTAGVGRTQSEQINPTSAIQKQKVEAKV